MIADGADIIDVGAEFDAPLWRRRAGERRGGTRAASRRCLAAVCALGTPVSIDTMKAEVARWALTQGAAMINDVWGLQRDPDMAAVVAEHRTSGRDHA